jgi:predicted kinase
MQRPIIVIVSGLPATGKTTLAKKIGEKFKLPVFTKDDVKVLIADGINAKNPSVKGLGSTSNSILFYIAVHCLENGYSLIIEGNFKDTKQTKEFITYLKKANKRVCEIHCVAEYQLRFKRYNSRERHPIHAKLSDPKHKKSFNEAQCFALGVGNLLKVDTSDLSTIPYKSIFDTVAGLD